MSQNKETPILLLSLLITVGLIAGGYWWFSRNSNFNLSQTFSENPGSGNDRSNTTSREPSGLAVAVNPGGIYYASAPEVVPQCSIKPLPIGRTQGQLVAPYQEPFVLPNECPGKRNQLNTEAFRSGRYPITRNLFVVIKQTEEIEQQVGMAYANLLLTEQGQELVTQAGFVKIR